jgi:hypothetical protein
MDGDEDKNENEHRKTSEPSRIVVTVRDIQADQG